MAEQRVVRAGYRRIAEQLEQLIEDGTYPVEGLLPSYDAIAAEYEVSKSVARDAVGVLGKKGIVDVAAGIGTTVLRKPSEVPPERDIQTQLGAIDATVQQLSSQLGDEVVPDLRELREQLGVLQGQIMDLYSKVGAPYPHEQSTAIRPRKAGGKTARSA